MKDSFSFMSPKEAGVASGYSARHIQTLITQGKIAATKEEGKYYIEKSEFYRLFPKAHEEEMKRNVSLKASEAYRIECENNMLKQMNSQKDKEIEFLRNQIESVAHEKLKMLEVIMSNTRLLEHKKQGQI